MPNDPPPYRESEGNKSSPQPSEPEKAVPSVKPKPKALSSASTVSQTSLESELEATLAKRFAPLSVKSEASSVASEEVSMKPSSNLESPTKPKPLLKPKPQLTPKPQLVPKPDTDGALPPPAPRRNY
ncbi:hypothetical protein CANTEDRAFT_115062 [Yamadazyma tenuis ATCC 10573]|uniref:Uncharacterized protein n=2 Tax=Candida tenuis TaxID=2315449 RepID=G3B798_CANTC|nr:uncharacterized protein CANTEDRAFT_115062 [Yamadazyma tenuis ATCC 10573]EGV61604.1 hypothetical protein CANTEDRAFT_115062 [Yamadazyma tenuis ATCC 10573]